MDADELKDACAAMAEAVVEKIVASGAKRISYADINCAVTRNFGSFPHPGVSERDLIGRQGEIEYLVSTLLPARQIEVWNPDKAKPKKTGRKSKA